MLKQFLNEEEGQTTVEYLLIIAVVVVVITAMGAKIKPLMEQLTEKVFAGVNKKVGVLMGAANN